MDGDLPDVGIDNALMEEIHLFANHSEANLLGQAVTIHTGEIYTKGWDLKDRLSQAEELERIEAIVW